MFEGFSVAVLGGMSLDCVGGNASETEGGIVMYALYVQIRTGHECSVGRTEKWSDYEHEYRPHRWVATTAIKHSRRNPSPQPQLPI